MSESDRLSGGIEWIDLSFVERQRTPEWAIQVGIRCHLAGMSLRDASQFLEELGVQRSHVSIHEWVHKADLQPISTVTADQLAVDEKMIRSMDRNFGCTALSIRRRTKFSISASFRRQRNRRRGGFWPSFITSISSTRCCFSSTMLITLVQFWLKMATDFRLSHMEIGMPSNVFSGK